ncbi:hypothetical protein MMC17_001602 [Xylographa soralifera]|nr:hypothetical protein [Xylographa soralifera]
MASIADEFNPCIKLVMEKGFNPSNGIMFDTFARRENRDSLGRYSNSTRRLHLSWSKLVESKSMAKIELVFGAKNREMVLHEYEMRSTPLFLWGNFAAVRVLLAYHDCHKDSIERVLVLGKHPEELFHDWTVDGGKNYDCALKPAAMMAKIRPGENTVRPMEQTFASGSGNIRINRAMDSHSDDEAMNNYIDITTGDDKDETSSPEDWLQDIRNMERFAGSVFAWDEFPHSARDWLLAEYDVEDDTALKETYTELMIGETQDAKTKRRVKEAPTVGDELRSDAGVALMI